MCILVVGHKNRIYIKVLFEFLLSAVNLSLLH